MNEIVPQASSGGRIIIPQEYRQDALDVICEYIADGKLLQDCSAEKIPGMPPLRLIKSWIATNPVFQARFVNAQRTAALIDASEIVDIADGNDGHEVARDRLRVSTRLKLAAKLWPEIYSDKIKVDQNVTHEAGSNLSSLLSNVLDINTSNQRGMALPSEDDIVSIVDITPEAA